MEYKMKYNKRKGFTLAEVMVLLATLTVLMAAFAPIFTRRYTAGGIDDVWSYVPGDNEYDAYYDSLSKKQTAQAFIGITPTNSLDVQNAVKDGNNNILYSKLVIRASDNLSVGKPQNQIQFRYAPSTNSAAGELVGSLFAGNNNMLIGGTYSELGKNNDANTSFGANSLSSLTTGLGVTAGIGNTAVGYNALKSVTTGGYNTAIGYNAGKSITTFDRNTFVGYNAGSGNTGSMNTGVGSYTMAGSGTGNANVAVGNHILEKSSAGTMNTAVGNYALNSLTSGYGNTALGYNAMASLIKGSYNTAIGANSCNGAGENVGYVTCIGYNAGTGTTVAPFKGTDPEDEVVLIGTVPEQKDEMDQTYAPSAVLEVHNRKTANKKITLNTGDESVVINGNLIVRGQSYFESYMIRQINGSKPAEKLRKGLVGFKLVEHSMSSGGSGRVMLFAGYDGIYRTGRSRGYCKGWKWHVTDDIRPNCVCTAVGDEPNSNHTQFKYTGTDYKSSKSYDWATKMDKNNGLEDNNESGAPAKYKDGSYSRDITLERYAKGTDSGLDANYPGTDRPYAHLYGNASCCPMLSSDIRLKNVGEKFTGGLAEIKKLNVYNYTFKNDPNKLPHVGVIAQDLKMVFPNAVVKGDDGYYKIRWDEMLYAAINAVKELNTKVSKIANRIESDKNRVATLKKDNAQLNAQLDKLADELTVLESKKHK